MKIKFELKMYTENKQNNKTHTSEL